MLSEKVARSLQTLTPAEIELIGGGSKTVTMVTSCQIDAQGDGTCTFEITEKED